MADMKTGLLFYDPEENVLKGLKRALHGMRNQWNMEFCHQINQAEQILLKHKPDILVADISHAHKSGQRLLQTALNFVPGTIRIGISADTDERAAIQSLNFTHNFLAKPFEAEDLRAIISRALLLQNRINNPQVKEFVSQVTKLPTVPDLLQQINQLLQSDEASLTEIAAIIEKDINITTQLLKIVNSAYFGLFKNISSAQHAVSLLGLDLIKNLIWGIDLFKGLNYPPSLHPFIENIWRHSLSVARILQEIVMREYHDKQLAATAFSLGILHDVGKLVFIEHRKEEYTRLCTEALENRRPCWEIEKERFQLTHADAGAYLLGLWGLPDILVFAVAESHEYESTRKGSDYLAKILRIADALQLGRDVPVPQDQNERETMQNWAKIAREILEGINK